MSVAACLLLYSFTVAVLVPRPLRRLTRRGTAPRVSVLAWLVVMVSVVGSWAAAAASLAVEAVGDWGRPAQLASTCFAAVQAVATGRYGIFLQAGLIALATAAAAALVALACRLGRALHTARARTHEHASAARIVGHRVEGVDAVVLDATERAAYCVAGRPGTIVVTSSALDVLDRQNLAAVLAHEHAHLDGRHHQILAFTRGLAAILPWAALFTIGAAEVARTLEMCADDAAVRRHGPDALLDGLLALTGQPPLPTGVLGATGANVLARAERLTLPAAPRAQWQSRLVLTLVTLAAAAGPVLTGLLAASGLGVCDLSFS
ncbi:MULTISPECIES: M56 family metallopeptidase [Amycolatopsis]|uniref:Beta-lactamase regulating signal transducer with metallopeptidase domain n=1 Tax=Amycolatopsis echigonensis TaxID=2576905 RepID=A0A2N3WL77_9PSEU|nr:MULTISPECIES: M56 family metallopeptidase [Amycolatopsis]MBB2499925.1 M56 family metallopeptidase [Amycolatopsis echigonensis]MCG3751157.1 M56 family metallopeptidase [Amycolatopsis sp. Poz14]PKV94619.1 beta-lactamase regulating signal transducer with metallopeptidase domain [Amycolatopsis niigatensis]